MEPDNHYQAHTATGRTYHYVDQRPRYNEHATLLCLHGFPDLWYGWRHQIRPWVAAGYRVIVPDMLGYGKTDMPLEASAYSTKRLCDDLAALLDHLGVQKAVIIGHDWGSFTAGRFALWYPERLLALVMLSAPYTPPLTRHMPVHEIAQRYPSFSYQVYFASEQSTAEIEARLPSFFRLLFSTPSQTKLLLSGIGELQKHLLSGTEPDGCILNEKELEYYISNFQRGMTGPLSYYRTTKSRFDEEKDATLPSKLRSDLPVLFVYGTEDVTCPPVAVRNSAKFIDQLKVVPISGVGHWVMVEASQTVTEAILHWLGSALAPRVPAHL
ncbi:Alpha/Beta hydrolase protein [Boletus coccyginus]|nr:Alpha/Beta hydrolase protein [Boletus coccyginus]